MTTNLAEARSLARRDRRPSRNRDRQFMDRSRSRTRRSSRGQIGEDEDADHKTRLESRRSRYKAQFNQEAEDPDRVPSTRRSARRRSRSSSTGAEDDREDGRQDHRNSQRLRKSLDLTDRQSAESKYCSRENRQIGRNDSNRSTDHWVTKHSPHSGAVTASLSRSGADGPHPSSTRDRPSLSGSGTTEAPRASAGYSRGDVRPSHRRAEEQLELERARVKESSKTRRERSRYFEEAQGSSVIQASQCMMDCDTQDDPLKEIVTLVLQDEQNQAKKLAEQEQARKIAERAAIRERRRIERERLEREREAAESAAAMERAVIAQKAAAAAEKMNAARQPECVEETPTAPNISAEQPKNVSVHLDSRAEQTSGVIGTAKSRSPSRKKTVDIKHEEEPAKPIQTPRRTLVVRDATIPPDTQEEDRVILVSGIDDEGARAKKPSDYKREASTGFVRKRSVNVQPAVEFTAPTGGQSTHRSVKIEKTSSSPFRPCPGFSGVEGSNELMKALAFRRQKTMGTEKEYHATGNNSSLVIDDRVVKTGSVYGDEDDDDEDSYSID